MSRWFAVVACCAFVLAAVALSACGDSGDDSSSGSTASAAADTTTSDAGSGSGDPALSDADTSGKTIGILSLAPISDIQTLVEQMQNRCAKDHGWTVKVANANGDPATAQNAVNQFIGSGVDAIYNIGFDYTALARQATDARARDIPFVSAFANAPPGTLHLDPLNWESAVNQVQYMVDSLGGRGNVATILSRTASPVIRIREQALTAVLRNYPDIRVVARHELDLANAIPDSTSATQSILQSNKDLDAMYIAYDDPAIGAIQAIDQAGRSDQIKVFSFNGQPNMLDQLRKEGSPAFSSAFIDLEAGTQAVCYLLQQSLAGEEIPETNLYVQEPLITRVNVPESGDPPGVPVITLSGGEVNVG